MPAIKTRDNTEIYYNDWGTGQPVVFSRVIQHPIADFGARRPPFAKDAGYGKIGVLAKAQICLAVTELGPEQRRRKRIYRAFPRT